jgi:hypothetical protein
VVQKPFMLRRSWATFARQWPGPQFQVTGPDFPLLRDYVDESIGMSLDVIVSNMVGDAQRLLFYSEVKDFQAPASLKRTAVVRSTTHLVISLFVAGARRRAGARVGGDRPARGLRLHGVHYEALSLCTRRSACCPRLPHRSSTIAGRGSLRRSAVMTYRRAGASRRRDRPQLSA